MLATSLLDNVLPTEGTELTSGVSPLALKTYLIVIHHDDGISQELIPADESIEGLSKIELLEKCTNSYPNPYNVMLANSDEVNIEGLGI